MEELYKELNNRYEYLESLEQTDNIKARMLELSLVIIRVQQILLENIKNN